uniref:Secreted protein n=1 Tax=Tetraselmis sp. GSL018 TaxID=582737 RepID=A0A061SJG1_9CHLO
MLFVYLGCLTGSFLFIFQARDPGQAQRLVTLSLSHCIYPLVVRKTDSFARLHPRLEHSHCQSFNIVSCLEVQKQVEFIMVRLVSVTFIQLRLGANLLMTKGRVYNDGVFHPRKSRERC